jgi:hypothetical protein
LTKLGQVEAREVARIRESRRQAGLELGGCEVQQAMGGAVVESGIDAFPDRTVHGIAILPIDLTDVEMALRR